MLETRRSDLPEDILTQYPFAPHWFELSSGHTLHYVDEGKGPVIFLLHGNPTWSFYYRHVIQNLKNNYRVIAPDHLGCGLSEKPQDKELYTLKNHINNFEELIDGLQINDFSLVVHDWGGAIGCGVAVKRAENLRALALHNTAAFTSEKIAKRIDMLRNTLGETLIRRFNAFAWPATFMAVQHKMDTTTKRGFLFPYDSYENRIATARFVRDIPMEKDHPSYETLLEIEQNLKKLTCPKLIQWGLKDFCFHQHFLNKWKKIFPQSELASYPEGGHYLIEDAEVPFIERLQYFFNRHLVSANPSEGL